MKGVLIALYLFIFVGTISAQSIELTYPSEVCIGEEFKISLKLIDFENTNYDIKIDITKDGARVSRVLVDGLWKSTFYYVKEAVTNEGEFSLKIVEAVEGEADIVVRVRRSGGSASELFGGYEIKVISGGTNSPEENDREEDKKELEEDTKENINKDHEPNNNPTDVEVSNAKKSEKKNDTPIKIEFVQSKSIKTESSTNFYKNLYGLGGIFAISIFLGMVYIKKQGKYKNEFR